MKKYIIKVERDFSDYAWEVESKGCLEVDIQIFDKLYTFNFYDPIRLNQAIEDDLNSNQYFFMKIWLYYPK